MRVPSITFRLTLFFAIASTAVLLAVGYLLSVAVELHFLEQDRDELNGKLELVRRALAKVRTQSELDAIPQLFDDALVGHRNLSISVFAPNGGILFASSDEAFPGAALDIQLKARRTEESTVGKWEIGGHEYRDIVADVPTGMPGVPPAKVAIAINIDHQHVFMAALRERLWLAIVFGVTAMAVLGWVAARRGLFPVRRLAAVAQRISAARMEDRLPLESVPGELRELAGAFNAMLDRLEVSFRRLSDFSSDLAHEMRTPVSNLMTQAGVALSHPRTSDEYREILYSSLEEYERLARMIADMLFLAKADDGKRLPRHESVDLAGETKEVFEFFAALAEERSVALELVGHATIQGEALMIRRAISNLISNAIRYTRQGGAVRVCIGRTGSGQVQLAVENPGSEISVTHLPRLFDRFYRAGQSRQKDSDGVGLGLAITKSIVEAHQGTIEATSSPTMTRFVITFPATAQARAEDVRFG